MSSRLEWYLIKLATPAEETDIFAPRAVCVFRADNKADILAAQGMYGANDKEHTYMIENSENVEIVNANKKPYCREAV